jgi:monoamine oxidase
MARTPLMGVLQRLARDHREAERLGVRPADVRELRAEASGRGPGGLSRREFLRRSGALGAAVSVAGSEVLTRPAHAASGPRIAIVGGGIAGLAAALTLADKGVAATVYESSARIGGRMHSDTIGYWTNGQTSEWCGELIDSGHKTILSLAQRFRLATVDLLKAEPHGSTDTDWFFGAYYSSDQADDDFQPVHQALQRDVHAASYPTTYNHSTLAGRVLDNQSVYDWIETRVAGGHASSMAQLLDVAYNEEYGADTSVQSALNLVYLLGYNATPGNFAIFGASDERYRIVGGNEQLPQAIAAALPPRATRTGWAMRSIKRNIDGSLALTFATGGGTQTITADHVVLAMSFAVLSTLDYAKAGFDDLKRTAIAQLGAGRNAKLQLQFDARYWNTSGPWGISNGNVYTDTGFQNAWDVTRGQPGATGIVVNYTGGSVAGAFSPPTPYSRASTSPQVTTYAQSFLSQLELIWPGISAHWNGKATLSAPFLDPNLNCSYSYWKVGQYQTFAGYEGVRQGNIHFAGEHCSQDFQGYMEGGASEGIRAANEILADIAK